jgi:hypothetical protein
MNAFNVGMSNYQTTLAGAGLGTAYYVNNVGLQFPSNQGEWVSFAVSLLLYVLGLLAKDAVTGSRLN